MLVRNYTLTTRVIMTRACQTTELLSSSECYESQSHDERIAGCQITHSQRTKCLSFLITALLCHEPGPVSTHVS